MPDWLGTTEVKAYLWNYRGLRVWLVDTPGFNDTNIEGKRTDTDVLKVVAIWLAAAYSTKTKLAGIIYLHAIHETRMTGASLKNLIVFRSLCSEENQPGIVLITTRWTDRYGNRKVSTEEGEARIEQLLDKDVFWGLMFRSRCSVENHSGSAADAHRIVSTIIDRQDARRFSLPLQKADGR